jgi:TPR repeat protein
MADNLEEMVKKGLEARDRGDFVEAFKLFQKAAEQGNAEGQYRLGFCYDTGEGVKEDKEQEVYWYTKAAEQGHAKGQCNLGYCYETGEGVKEDKEQSVYWYTKAAEQDYAQAQFNLGTYYNGEGVKQDQAKAFYWYTKAAEQGHAGAQCNLGVCYCNGEGVKQDQTKAAYWWEKAAEQGHAGSQFILGICYANGEGVKQDDEKADYWYRKAVEQGHKGALDNLIKFYLSGKGSKKDPEQEEYWYNILAEFVGKDTSTVNEQYDLGMYCYKGRAGKQSHERAVYWFTKTAACKFAPAQNMLAICYEDGIGGLKTDYKKAVDLYTEAAKQGNKAAQENLQRLGETVVGIAESTYKGASKLLNFLDEALSS